MHGKFDEARMERRILAGLRGPSGEVIRIIGHLPHIAPREKRRLGLPIAVQRP